MITGYSNIISVTTLPAPLLLDLYPSAAAAYSLRKLRTDYTGSAIRVRRSSDNAEQDIGFDATGNLDTSSLTTFCGVGNGFVTTWYDQSGNANNATQTTAANQPQIVSSGSILLINTKPSLNFDGSNDNFIIPYIGTTSNMSFLKLEKWNTTASGQLSTAFSNGGPYVQWINQPNSFANYLVGFTQTTATTNQILYSFYERSGFYENNSLIVSKVATAQSITEFTIGSFLNNSLYANVNVQEFIFYPSNNLSNRTAINTNINTYYGIY